MEVNLQQETYHDFAGEKVWTWLHKPPTTTQMIWNAILPELCSFPKEGSHLSSPLKQAGMVWDWCFIPVSVLIITLICNYVWLFCGFSLCNIFHSILLVENTCTLVPGSQARAGWHGCKSWRHAVLLTLMFTILRPDISDQSILGMNQWLLCWSRWMLDLISSRAVSPCSPVRLGGGALLYVKVCRAGPCTAPTRLIEILRSPNNSVVGSFQYHSLLVKF